MGFWKRKKNKPAKPSEDFLDDDFGYDAPGQEGRRPEPPRPADPPRESSAPPPPASPRMPSGVGSPGRGLDDVTIVPRNPAADSSPPLVPPSASPPPTAQPPSAPPPPATSPPPPPAFDPPEQGDDMTVVLGAPVAPSQESVAWLVATTGAGRGRDHRLAPSLTKIGSAADAGLRLTGDPYVSSGHAEIDAAGGAWRLRDLGSTNGTLHNGQPVNEVTLRDGDRIRFGQSEFVFKCCEL